MEGSVIRAYIVIEGYYVCARDENIGWRDEGGWGVMGTGMGWCVRVCVLCVHVMKILDGGICDQSLYCY